MSYELLSIKETEENKEDLEILLSHYPLDGCGSCSYTVDKAIADCSSGSFSCQNCGNFKHFVNEVLFEEME